jgi:LPS O-antigen subunit length determinant protein (WzzB/FepE family)
MDVAKGQETTGAKLRVIPDTATYDKELEDRRRRLNLNDVLIRWRSLIIASTLLGCALAFVSSFFSTEIFESRAVIQIGQTVQSSRAASAQMGATSHSLLESPEILVERLKEEYQIGDGSEGSVKLPYLKDARINRSAKVMVVLTSQGDAPESARAFLVSVADKVIEHHKTILETSLIAAKEQSSSLQKQLQILNQQIKMLSDRATDIGRRDVASAVILTAQRGELMERIIQLEQQHYELVASMSDVKPSVLIRNPTLSAQRIAPDRSLYALSGAVLGLFIGFFIAVCMHRRQFARTPNSN